MRKKIITMIGIMTLGGMLMTGCAGQNNSSVQNNGTVNSQTDATEDTTNTVNNTTNTNTANTNTNQTGNNQNSGQISAEEAKKIALDHAGVKESDVTSIQTKQDIDDGNSIYEVEFYTADKKYDYDIKMDDGTVLKVDFEAIQNANGSNGNQTQITEEEAMNIVLKKVDGATKDMISMHQDVDDGMLLYEGQLIYNGTEYEFEINAYTGDIIKWEQDSFQ